MLSGTSMLVTISALVGFNLAADKSLATLPLAAQFIATMLTTIPAAFLMSKIGRRHGFMLSTGFAISGAALAAVAILNHQFWWFVVATMLIGIFNGFGNYYRFTAADSVEDDQKSQAISLIVAGGVVAAFIGPNLASYTYDLLAPATFAASFLALIFIYIASLGVLSRLTLPHRPAAVNVEEEARPLAVIVRQPKFVVAVICGMLGYGVMALIMTATPLAMQHHAHGFGDTSFVIQWHVLAMFVPSFFTGYFISRVGDLTVMAFGALMGIACVAINLLGTSVWHFWAALLLLGVSWNFLFVGATTLLTETYRLSEKFKVQATNDFIVFTTVALSSLSAGMLQNKFGWRAVNWGVLPMLLIVAISLSYLYYITRKTSVKEEVLIT